MEPRLDPSDFVDVSVPNAADLAAEGALRNDPLLIDADSYESRVATAERYGSSQPGPVHSSQEAQTLQDLADAETRLAELEGLAPQSDGPEHKDYLTPRPERPGSADDRQRTRLRIEALNAPRELGGLSPYALVDSATPGGEIGGTLGVEFTDTELDVYAAEGRDPVAEMAQQILDREKRSAAQALDVARREQAYQHGLAQREAAQQGAYDRQAQAAIDTARARGADESWIRFALSMRALPGHPDTGR